MAGSPFDKKGGNATATAPAKATSNGSDLPDAVNLGEDQPISKGDPFAAADPSGVSGYKPLYFLNQLVLMHPSEHGSMRTSSNTPENPESEFVRFDIIPLTVPDSFTFLNKDGDEETCEPYEVGERLEDILVFNKALVREGKKALDKGTAWLLGRIVKGNKKPGQSAPYILVAGSDEDKAIYQEWRNNAAKAK